ncbi:MAG: hypothetical protein M1837_003636 [Sclerophora amabilis]|nr:MAG: hypothetical protein M1837_003636 [Sclerophora amabilis]
MTSISQPPSIPPQAANPTSTPQPANPAHSAPSTGAPASTLAAAPPSANPRSYASATKKSFSPPIVSGSTGGPYPPAAVGGPAPAHHVKSSSVSPVGGKPSIPPAVPTVGPPAASAIHSNSNNLINGASAHPTHARKSSVTISAAGTSGHMPNGGGPVAAPPSRPNNIIFGSMNSGASPAASHSVPQLHQPAPSLPAAVPDNPRISSPQTSPSPIPPPATSGGRPPSALHGQSSSMSFGSLPGESNDANRPMRPLPQGPVPQGPQPMHLRRESSQSAHGEMNHAGMSPGPGRGGYPPQGGRGRGYGQQYNPHSQMNYQQSPGYRHPPNQARGGSHMGHQFQGQGAPTHYPNSPHRNSRSPALTHSVPSTPQMQQAQMAGAHMHNQQMGGYPQMGPPQVNSPSSSYVHPDSFTRDQKRSQLQPHDSLSSLQPLPTPNLSPESGFMEHYLMAKHLQGNYAMPQSFEAGYGPYPPPYPMYPGMFMGGQSGSPRPQYQNLSSGNPQPYVPGQYGQSQPQPQPMSRTSSSVSEQRPNSSVGQPATPSMIPATGHAHQASQGKISPAPNANFKIPGRKSAGIVIKDPNSGAVKTFDKPPTSPAPVSRSPAVSSTPTPPPRSESHHSRSESKTVKSDAEKRKETIDAIAKKIAEDKAEEQRAIEEAEQKAIQEKEDAERAQKEAEEKARRAKEEAEAALREAEAKAQREEDERIQKEQEAKAKKEEEARLKAVEEENKRRAEEAEAARQKAIKENEEREEALAKAEEAAQEEASRAKDEGPSTPAALPANVAKIPVESGTSTPGSDDSMGPPPRPVSSGKRDKPAALNLAPLKTNSVEPPQPSAALQSLRSARFIDRLGDVSYPSAFASPNPALNNSAVKGRFKYDRDFLLQFKPVFTEKPSTDWDHKLKETVGDTSDSARPQSARTPSMGPRNTSGRPGIPQTFSSMGTFGQAGGKTLPPGTTSEQRFAMSNTQRPAMSNPLAQFARPGAPFPMGGPTPMSRTNSSSTLQSQGGAPQSPRSNNRSQRNNSKRGGFDKSSSKTDAQEAKEAKSMPLTSAGDVKPLPISTGGWKPRSLASSSSATGASGPAPGASNSNHMEPDMVQRKVKSNLNKMTPEKFEKIADQILEIAAQSKDESDGRTLRQVIQLTFEKATDEAHWASMYAKFCKRMLESMSPEIKDDGILDKNGNIVTGGNLFRKYLLNRCQEEFERGWKSNLPEKPEGESEEAAMMSEEYYIAAAAKRRGLGLVQFIGELYKLGMLTERIMHECVKKLVDYENVPDEAEVESLSKLLRTIGYNLDHTEKGKPLMDVYFQRIQAMMETSDLNSRYKFMLLDVIDLRRKNWAASEANKGPQTIQEIREEAARQQVEKEAERQRQQSQRHHGGGGGRMPMGRGDARSFSGGGQYGMMQNQEPQRATVGMDELRRLSSKTGSRQASQGQMSFGPTSMFTSRSSSGRKPLGPGALSRGGEDSSASSRTGTPPATKEKEPAKHANAFSALAALESSGEPADPTSPPSATSSPPVAKAKLGAAGAASGGLEERPKSPLGRTTEKESKSDEPPAGSSTS